MMKKVLLPYMKLCSQRKVPELRHRLPNEILSRDEMKKNPPNILFTNYAMLEHLLLRPKDDVLSQMRILDLLFWTKHIFTQEQQVSKLDPSS